MRPLKIALLSRWYWEENQRHGPAGGMVRQVAEAVAADGHEVVVLSQSPETVPLKKMEIGKLETWLSPRDKKRDFVTGLRDKWAKQTYGHRKVYTDALALGDFLSRRGPFDVLWAQSEEADGLVAGIAAQLGIPLPPTLTQIQSLRYQFREGALVFTGKPALSLAFRHATRVIANSELVANCLGEYANSRAAAAEFQAKVRVVYPNLVWEFLHAAEEISPAPAPVSAHKCVLFFGALNEKKGALVFLEAIAKTEAAQRGATFAMIGDFTEKNPEFVQRWNRQLEIVRNQLPLTQLDLLGKISSFEAIRQIKLASVVVVPSLFDEFSRTVAEALVLGRPVITTDRVGASRLVEAHNCGVIVPPHDAAALAGAINDALALGAPYAVNAQRIAHRLLHELSPEAIAHQIAHHLSEIAAT